MAATTGLPSVSSLRRSALMPSEVAKASPASSGPRLIIPFRSPPAKKVFFALAITTPVIESCSSTSRCTALCMDSLWCSFSTLAEPVGSSSDSVTMPSASLSHAMVFSAMVLNPLDDGGHAHTAADAQRDQGTSGATTLELVDHGSGDHGAGGAQRVAHRDGATVDVELLVGDVEVLLELQHHGGEGLVELEQVDVIDGQAGTVQHLLGGRGGAGEHDDRVGAAGG